VARIRLVNSARVAAWRAVMALLQADPRLRTIRPDWRTPDSAAYDDPPASDRVTIRFMPRFGTPTPIAASWPKRTWEAPVTLGIEVTMPEGGADVESSQQVWEAIESAVLDRYPAGSTDPSQPTDVAMHLRALDEAGVTDIEFTAPTDAVGDGETGQGGILITCYVEG
jgi:hypothetical protein